MKESVGLLSHWLPHHTDQHCRQCVQVLLLLEQALPYLADTDGALRCLQVQGIHCSQLWYCLMAACTLRTGAHLQSGSQPIGQEPEMLSWDQASCTVAHMVASRHRRARMHAQHRHILSMQGEPGFFAHHQACLVR